MRQRRAQPLEKGGQDGRQDDAEEPGDRADPENARHVEIAAGDIAHALEGAERHRQGGRLGDQDDLDGLAHAEQQDEGRYQGDRRQLAQDKEARHQIGLGLFRGAHQRAEADAGDRADGVADDQAQQRIAQMLRQFAVRPFGDEGLPDHIRRHDDITREQAAVAERAPRPDQDER